MKKTIWKSFVITSILASSFSSYACSKLALWIETPSLGSAEESRQLFKEVQHKLETNLKDKKFNVIPFGTYTRGSEENICELNLIVSRGIFGNLKAELTIDSLDNDFSERVHSDQGGLNQVLNRIPKADEI